MSNGRVIGQSTSCFAERKRIARLKIDKADSLFFVFVCIVFSCVVPQKGRAETLRCGGESYLLRVSRHPLTSLEKTEKRRFWSATEKGDLNEWVAKLLSEPKGIKTQRRLQEVGHQWRALGFLESSQKVYRKLSTDYKDFLATFFLAYDASLRRDTKEALEKRKQLRELARSKKEKIMFFLFESRWLQEHGKEENVHQLYEQSHGQEEWLRLFLLEQWSKRVLRRIQKDPTAKKVTKASLFLERALKRHQLSLKSEWIDQLAQIKSYGSVQSQKEACVLYRKLKDQIRAGKWLLNMGRCAEREKKPEKAKQLYQQTIERSAGSSHAEKAWKALQRLEKRSISAQLAMAVADHFFRRMQWKEAERYVEIARKKTDQKNRKRRLLLDTRRSQISFRKKEYTNCAKILAPWEKENRRSLHQREDRKAFLLFVRCNYRASPSKKSIKDYEWLAEQSPHTQEGKLALWGAAQIHAENKREKESRRWLILFANAYPTSPQVKEGFFQIGWIQYQKKDFSQARETFRRQIRQGREATAKSWFWIGKTYEQEGNHSSAKRAFQRAYRARHGYYSIEAGKRLSQIPKGLSSPISLIWSDQEEREEAVKVLAWSKKRARKKQQQICGNAQMMTDASVIELLTLTGWTEAAYKRSRAWEKRFQGVKGAYLQARFWRFLGHTDRVLGWGAKMRTRMNSKDRKTFPSEVQQRVLFPIAYPGMYVTYGKEYRIPALFMMGLTRQESLFSASVVSGAGARGIAQIMPKDAKNIAKKQNIASFRLQDLFLPTVNLRMGFFHFRDYLDRHEQQKDLTLAAYNAGPEALRRWKEKHGKLVEKDRDAFLAFGIGYSETRQYVVRCLRWYRTYRYYMRPSKSF